MELYVYILALAVFASLWLLHPIFLLVTMLLAFTFDSFFGECQRSAAKHNSEKKVENKAKPVVFSKVSATKIPNVLFYVQESLSSSMAILMKIDNNLYLMEDLFNFAGKTDIDVHFLNGQPCLLAIDLTM